MRLAEFGYEATCSRDFGYETSTVLGMRLAESWA